MVLIKAGSVIPFRIVLSRLSPPPREEVASLVAGSSTRSTTRSYHVIPLYRIFELSVATLGRIKSAKQHDLTCPGRKLAVFLPSFKGVSYTDPCFVADFATLYLGMITRPLRFGKSSNDRSCSLVVTGNVLAETLPTT